jgi:hypothetical protein
MAVKTGNSQKERGGGGLLDSFKRKILRRIFGLVRENWMRRIRYNEKLYTEYKELDLVSCIKFKRRQWAGHACTKIPSRPYTQKSTES